MERLKACCKGSCGDEEEVVDIAEVLQSCDVQLVEDAITQLFADIEQIIERGRNAEKVPMSKEVEKVALHLQMHLDKVISGVQTSKDALNALGMVPWVGAGLTIIAMVLDMALKTHDNKEQCSYIVKESLDIWKKIMKPILETKGLASDYMRESIGIIVEGYLYCRNLLNSRTWKRFICACIHERDLETWKRKREDFLAKASAVMNAEIVGNLLPNPPPPPKTFATTLVGLEGRQRDVMKLLKLEDKEETRVVVLHGMGGVGKSTLGDAVYKEASMSRERQPRCRIELGEKPTKEHITSLQRQMVENLTGKSLNKMERDPWGIADEFRQVLLSESEEPVLIYMDNVLQSKDLEEFLSLDCERIKLPKGSRLLVTTRDVSVCTEIFQRNQHFEVKEFRVKLLNDRDAEKLFFLHAFGQEDPRAELVQRYDDDQGLIENMVRSICGNLPLALRVLGRSLFNKNVQSWRKKYDDLKISTNRELGEKVTTVLRSSYDTLDSETQTAFLMACVCFYNSPYEDFREVVASLLPTATITRLIELGLLETHSAAINRREADVGVFIKMHDLVKNLGYQMAVDRKCAPTRVPTCKQDFLDLSDECCSELKWLRIPALEDGIEAEFLEKCKELELIVLNTHVIGHMRNPPQHLKAVDSTSRLTLEFDKLKDLIFWNVGTFLEEFPVTPSLTRLQVLKGFGGSNISEEAIDRHKSTLQALACAHTVELSPSFCEKMTKLRWLDLQDFKGESLPKEMGSLASLEVLYVTSTTIRELPQSLALLKRLQTLSLRLGNLKEIPSGVLGAMKELEWLQLFLEKVTSVPMHDIGQLGSLLMLQLILPSVRCLTDEGVSLNLEKLRWFALYCESLSSLEGVRLSCPSLECMQLGLESLQVLPSKFITGATNLRSLCLGQCHSLQELSAETEMLGAVESLAVVECPALKALPDQGTWMKTVERLAVVDCAGMGKLPADVVDEEKVRSMRLLVCDTHLLPPQVLALPAVVPYTQGDWRAEQQLDSFCLETFYPGSILQESF